ncbi:MAG: hypothetical protein K9J80_05530 [Sulfuritalea sp.]|nr:hypothetical protein [Sulfuritalea sp.]
MSVRSPTRNVHANEGLSILDLILALASEWRIVATCLVVGILGAALAYFRYEPTYSSNFVTQIGTTYGSSSPQALENPFLAARRVVLRFGGIPNEHIRTRTYEQNFDLKQRMTLEVSIETRSPERTLALANEIVGFLRAEHARFYSDELEKYALAKTANEASVATSQQLSDYYKKIYVERLKNQRLASVGSIEQIIDRELVGWAVSMEQTHKLSIEKLQLAMSNYRVVPTTFPLLPEVAKVVASTPDWRVFLSGFFGGLFFGMIGAALAQRWRQSRSGKDAHGKQAGQS